MGLPLKSDFIRSLFEELIKVFLMNLSISAIAKNSEG
jgi:hypothetical protein